VLHTGWVNNHSLTEHQPAPKTFLLCFHFSLIFLHFLLASSALLVETFREISFKLSKASKPIFAREASSPP
jgi:hypothetical protein